MGGDISKVQCDVIEDGIREAAVQSPITREDGISTLSVRRDVIEYGTVSVQFSIGGATVSSIKSQMTFLRPEDSSHHQPSLITQSAPSHWAGSEGQSHRGSLLA